MRLMLALPNYSQINVKRMKRLRPKQLVSSVRLLYSSFTTFKSKQFFFFNKKFKYLFGTHVKENTNKSPLAKTTQNISFILRIKTQRRKTTLI